MLCGLENTKNTSYTEVTGASKNLLLIFNTRGPFIAVVVISKFFAKFFSKDRPIVDRKNSAKCRANLLIKPASNAVNSNVQCVDAFAVSFSGRVTNYTPFWAQ